MEVKDDVVRRAQHPHHTLRTLGRLYLPRWRGVLLIVAFGVAAAVLTMETASINRSVVDRFAQPDEVWRLSAIWDAMLIGAGVLSWASAWATYRVGRMITAPLADRVFERLVRQSVREHEANDAAEGHTLVSRCNIELAAAISTGLSWTVGYVAQVTGGLLGMARMNWHWALAVVPLTVVAWLGAAWMGRRQNRLVGEQLELEKRRIELTEEVLDEQRFAVIKRNALEDQFVTAFAGATRSYERILRHRRFGFSIYNSALSTVPLLAAPLVWAAGSASGTSPGTAVAFAALLPQVMLAITGISNWYVNLADNAPYLHRALALLDTPTEEPDVDPSIQLTHLTRRPLVLEALCCTRGDEEVLRGIDLYVNPGDHIVIVGPNGAGKSTLLKAITKVLPVDGDGSAARIGPYPIARVPQKVLAHHVRAVDSTPAVFSGTVLENVKLYDKTASPEAIAWACGIAQIAFAPDRPASKLSDGQKIQILIAAAVLTRPEVLLLDEGLKHLNPETRANLRDALRRELPDTAVFEVSHAGAVMAPGATVVVVDGGVIAESGTHEELMAMGGRYARYVAASNR